LLEQPRGWFVYTNADCRAEDDQAIAIRARISLGGVFSTESVVAGGAESIDVVAGIHVYDPYISFRNIEKNQLEEVLKGYRNFTLAAKFALDYNRKPRLITISRSSWKAFVEESLSYRVFGVVAGNARERVVRGLGEKYAFIARVVSKSVPSIPLMGYSTRKGPRERNEDSLLVSHIVACSSGRKNVVRVGIVCDGAGGLVHGLQASAMGVLETFAKFLDLLFTTNDIGRSMKEAVMHANERILNYVKSIGRQVASTIAMIAVHENRVYYLNIGDTAIDVIESGSGGLRRLSRHHIVEVQGRYMLSSYLGHPNPEINMGVYELSGKSYIVVSTDGVHEILKNRMNRIVIDSKIPSIAANNLTMEAERLGSRDNMTAVAVLYQ